MARGEMEHQSRPDTTTETETVNGVRIEREADHHLPIPSAVTFNIHTLLVCHYSKRMKPHSSNYTFYNCPKMLSSRLEIKERTEERSSLMFTLLQQTLSVKAADGGFRCMSLRSGGRGEIFRHLAHIPMRLQTLGFELTLVWMDGRVQHPIQYTIPVLLM